MPCLDIRTPGVLNLITSLLQEGGQVCIQVTGRSMHPRIQDGDQVVLARARPDLLRPGDVLLIRTDQGLVVHRLVRRRRGRDGERLYQTKGDACKGLDTAVPARRVLARVVRVRGGSRSQDLTTRLARIRAYALARAGLCAYLCRRAVLLALSR